MQSHELPLSIDVDRRGGHPVLTLGGELDLATVPRLGAAVEALRRGSSSMLIDARALSFVDVRALRYLDALEARAKDEGWKLDVVRGPALERLSMLVGRLQSRRARPISLTMTATPTDKNGEPPGASAVSIVVAGTRPRDTIERPTAHRAQVARPVAPALGLARPRLRDSDDAAANLRRAIAVLERQLDSVRAPIDSPDRRKRRRS